MQAQNTRLERSAARKLIRGNVPIGPSDRGAFGRIVRLQRAIAPVALLVQPVFQWHAGYSWRPGLWLAVDVTYYTGGQTSVDGVPNQDIQGSVRYGLSLSAPLAAQWSAKLAWSRGLITRVGGDFQTVSVSLQYRWFNH
jgi:hypothetical protein